MSAPHPKTSPEYWTHDPLLSAMARAEPVCWPNPLRANVEDALKDNPFTRDDVAQAAARLERFAPVLARVFPETARTAGLIESPLAAIPSMRKRLSRIWGRPVPERLLLKLDSHLPVAGSIKARGGFYEVLVLAERLARERGLIRTGESLASLAGPEAGEIFQEHSLAVGSTGNLGLSVGLMGRALGFRVTVHMSADARQWKKDLLRAHGARVVEHAANYAQAVASGRAEAEADPRCHFVDDENSRQLFLGYATAGARLKAQLDAMGVVVDRNTPLAVHLPCGVGGGPGGVCFGLKLAFGEAVSCFFAEPVHAPAVTLGLATGLNDAVCAADLGLSGRTAADGLAVSRPSGLVCRAVRRMVDGTFTVVDDELFALLHLLAETEGIRLEPSALAGFPGVRRALEGVLGHPRRLEQATHVVWATGGSLVPVEEWAEYDARGAKRANRKRRVREASAETPETAPRRDVLR
ncbi:D-serine ammonia-lyase [Fundidesulfovibrio butyratiphilus]